MKSVNVRDNSVPDSKFSLSGRRALVTGGNSGLGAQISAALAAAGAEVFVVSRTGIDPLTGLTLPESNCLIADLTHPDAPKVVFDRFGSLDILVNCAGASFMNRAELISTADFMAILNINLTAAHALSAAFVQNLRERKTGGSIIHISSILAHQPIRGSAAYAASKAGLDQLTRVQALEWGRHNIRVNSIAPGWFETPLTTELLASPAGAILRRQNPLGRLGAAGDLDGAVLLLASDAGRYITGMVLTVDGGQSLAG
jgi:NAD(P)-dependent dehydrogenase (short-subunit alcohol dehydrogenase family)